MKKNTTKPEKQFLEIFKSKALTFYIYLIDRLEAKHGEKLENKKIEYSGKFEYFLDKKGKYNITVYEEKEVIKD